ncbi:hypothetical protein DFH07DRAFT_777633 [Mycena maculata]|uniref:Uncharacterized protein n=1 Tax=Mycena maculata TaxID=230809 RepID=A0AAD7II09_9AGAR|nr:hypothetical protein DFH07DRAFT_777633 [Mycena maculata]
MSHCYILGRLPVLSVQTVRTNRYSIGTILTVDDAEYPATLVSYMESPPLEQALFEVEAAFANNGGAETTVASDFREMELLGSDHDYLATCPNILPPRFNILGIVSAPETTEEFYMFNVAGTSYIVRVKDGNQPFAVKVRVDRSNPRWQSFFMPAIGQTVGVGGRLAGREQELSRLLIIDIARITYGPTPRTSLKTPTKAGAAESPSKSGGSSYAKNQRVLKRKRKDDDNDHNEVASQLST